MRTLALLLPLLSLHVFAAEVKQGIAGRNIQTVRFLSQSLGEERSVNVLLPADYDSSTRRYPVLYLLHGYGDDHTAWSYMTDLSGFAARYPVVIVMPDGSRSFYVNSASDPKAKFEDFITKDLVAYVDGHYRTVPLPRARAVAGLSMGGYGAVFLGLKHYKQFTAVGSFSGAVGLARDVAVSADEAERQRQAGLAALFGPIGSAERRDRDPFRLLEKVPAAQMPLLYVACGGEDFLVDQNRDFVKLLSERKVPYEYREVSPRGHSWDFWDDQVRVFLGLLMAQPAWAGE